MTIKPSIRTFLLALALSACLPNSVVYAQSMGAGSDAASTNYKATKLQPPAPEGGWASLARLLEAAKPSVDTRLDPTPAQITDYIEGLLNNGKNAQALQTIEARERERQTPGTDVQLMFQHARALAALGRNDEARALYQEMSTRFPELPEPWNNLGVLYAAQGDLNQAQDAFNMAIQAYPNYAAARANLADVQLMIALRSYRQEAARGVPGMQEKARELEQLLKNKSTS